MGPARTVTILLIRLGFLLCFMFYGINVNAASVASLCALLASFIVVSIQNKVNVKETHKVSNPFKGKPAVDEKLYQRLSEEVALEVSNFACYDAEHTDSLHNFGKIQSNTACIFAKKARLWGSAAYDSTHDIEYNIHQSLPTFMKFTLLCEPLGLDGFVLEIPADFGTSVQTFGAAVLRILRCLSQKDPTGKDCMKTNIERRGWVFEFNKVTFFITTFAPCYPDTHPRYGYDTDACYLLFQPELSFAQHDLPSDTSHTNWTHPRTVRDQIRVAFKQCGQEYTVRETLSFPMVWDIVRPLDKTENFVLWW